MRSRRVLLAVAVVAAGLYGVTAVGGSEPGDPRPEPLVAPAETGGYIWPYTSRSRSAADRTLPLNVVVHGDPERVRRAFVDRSGANWSETDWNATVVPSPWRPAHGSTRYTYVTPRPDAAGRWITPSYQLAAGAYFGRRTHVRAYPGPSDDWTALQVHTEYWDWFRVRHTVIGVATGAEFVERDLHDEPFVVDVSRRTHDHAGGGSAEWWTAVELLPAAAAVAGLAAPLTTRRFPKTLRRLPETAVLPAALVGVVLGVRAWGLAAEAAFPAVTPKLFVALGYPVLAAGPPMLVAALGRDESGTRLASLAAVGLGTGIALDLFAVGARHVPLALVGHRLALVAALGAVAVGVGREDQRALAVGLAAWASALAAPLVGVV